MGDLVQDSRLVIRTELGDHVIGPADDVRLIATERPPRVYNHGVPLAAGAQLVVQTCDGNSPFYDWRDSHISFEQPALGQQG